MLGAGVPLRRLADVPNPRADTFPEVSGGASSSGGTGAYSAMVVGLVWGMFRAEGRTITAIRTAAKKAMAIGG